MRHLSILLLLLLFVPLASGSDAELTVQGLEARASDIRGDVVVLKLLAEDDARPVPFFALDAASIRLEVDHSALVVETVQRTYVDSTTRQSTHDNAAVEGTNNGAEARWTLDPRPGHEAPTVQLHTSCMSMGPALRPTETTRAVVHDTDNRPDRVAGLSETVRPKRCPEAPVAEAVIRGDFRLSVWDWSFRLDDESGARVVETGVQPKSNGVGSEASEAFLFVTGGLLRVPLEDPSAFYLTNSSVSADELDLRGATGPLPSKTGTRSLDADDVTLYGVEGLTFTGRGVGEPLGVGVPQGMALAPATQTPASPLQVPEASALVAGLLMAVVAGLFLRYRPLVVEASHRRRGLCLGSRLPLSQRERRGLGYRFLARAAHIAHRRRFALHYARRAHALFPDQPEVRLMLATALSHQGRDGEALAQYRAAAGMVPDRQRRLKARAVLGITVSNAGLGDVETAVAEFERLAELDLDLATERLGSPSLFALHDHPRFQAVRHRLERLRAIPDRRAPKPGLDVA